MADHRFCDGPTLRQARSCRPNGSHVAVTLERIRRSLDPGQLQWGVEKITDTSVETVGTAKQAFVIDTQP